MSRQKCMPSCKRKCTGEFYNKYRIYETCCYDIVKVCPSCGQEFDHRQYHSCPRCGFQMDDPPGDPPRFGGRFGGGRRFGRFGGFRRFGFPFRRRFFSPFFPVFGFFPFEEEEEEEEEFF